MILGPWADDQEPCRAAVGLLKRLHEQLKSMTFGRKCPGGLGARSLASPEAYDDSTWLLVADVRDPPSLMQSPLLVGQRP